MDVTTATTLTLSDLQFVVSQLEEEKQRYRTVSDVMEWVYGHEVPPSHLVSWRRGTWA